MPYVIVDRIAAILAGVFDCICCDSGCDCGCLAECPAHKRRLLDESR
jgi:hypothetical protein